MPFFVSRCKEKGAAYSMAVHDFVSEHLIDWSQCGRSVVWSDGGKHFRSQAAIATVLCRQVSWLCSSGSAAYKTPSTEVNFGLACHFKNQCDGCQAQLRECLKEAALGMPAGEVIADPQTMIEKCRRIYDERQVAVAPGSRIDVVSMIYSVPREEADCERAHV